MVDYPKYDYSLAGRGYEKIPGTLFIQPMESKKEEQKKEAEENWETLKKVVKKALVGDGKSKDAFLNRVASEPRDWKNVAKEPLLAVAQGLYDIGEFGDAKNYGSYKERLEQEPLWQRKTKSGEMKFSPDSIPTSIVKMLNWFNKSDKEEGTNPVLEDYLAQAGGVGGVAGSSNPTVPASNFGSVPQIPGIDYSALRKQLQDLDLDGEYVAPQYSTLDKIGGALARIDLTSKLAGDWSKASEHLSEYSKKEVESKAAAKNKNTEKKQEIAMWKALKDIALQEANQNQAYKQAELGLRWQNAAMNAAMNQAKARAYYGGWGFGGQDKTREARTVGSNAFLIDFAENPKMSIKQANKKARAQAMTLPTKDQVPYILGYLSQYAAANPGAASE